MRTGYREMIRDRIPIVINFALKWCKAKERWIDHVYTHFVNIYVDKEERKRAVHSVLQIHKGKSMLDFHKSIFWDHFEVTDDEISYWEWVEDWVKWFKKYFVYMYNVYENSRDEAECKEKLLSSYLKNTNKDEQEKLANFIINCCKEYN